MKDMVGFEFGLWVILKDAERCKSGNRQYVCKCKCGTIKVVHQSNIHSGRTTSCGCNVDHAIKAATHGAYYTREYKIYHGMKTRCYNKKSKTYKNYGGRGIAMSDNFLESFENFIAAMGLAPTINHSIDRKDNEKGYSKENCRWATLKEQANNKRSNVKILCDGVLLSLADASKVVNIPAKTIYNRIHKLKWSDGRALNTPVNLNLSRKQKDI